MDTKMNNDGFVYSIVDSQQNLKIRVKLERVLSAGGGALPSFAQFISTATRGALGTSLSLDESHQRIAAEHEIEEYTFRWQEKVFSPRELKLYSNEANCNTPLEQKYYQDIQELLSRNALPTKRLFTCIEGDAMKPLNEEFDKLAVSTGQASFMADSLTNVRHRRIAPQSRLSSTATLNPVVESPTAEAIKKAHSLPQSGLRMHIMAYLGPKDSEDPEASDEKILCTIRIINEKQMHITPDFSNGQKPYRLEGKIGVFKFTLNNASEKINLDSISEIQKRESQVHDYKSSLLDSQVGTDFDVPEDGVLKTVILGEIVSAKDFEFDNLYVHYLVDLPKGWYKASDQKLEGITHISKSKEIANENVHYFSWPLELDLCYGINPYDPDPGGLPRWPQMFFAVYSIDSWTRHRSEGYGYCHLPTTPGFCEERVHTWRPSDGDSRSELRRFFTGGTPELESLDCITAPKDLKQDSKLSKFGFQTISSGSIKVQFRVIHQCRSFISQERQRQLRYGSILDRLGARSGLHSSIIGVLEAFQRARQRMLAARENIFAEHGFYAA